MTAPAVLSPLRMSTPPRPKQPVLPVVFAGKPDNPVANPSVHSSSILQQRLHSLQAFVVKSRLFEKYGQVNVVEAFDRLPDSLKKEVSVLLRQVDPMQDLMRPHLARRLGPAEEGPDALYEYYILRALRAGLIKPVKVAEWAKELKAIRDEKSDISYRKMYLKIANAPSKAEVEAFRDITGHDLDIRRAKHMLGLINFKFAICESKKPTLLLPLKLSLWKETSRRLVGEARELIAPEPLRSWQRLKMMTLGMLYATMPGLMKPDRLERQVQRYVERKLGAEVSHQELLDLVYQKQKWRQAYDYHRPDLTTDQRKADLKPFETLIEAYFLKQKALNPAKVTLVADTVIQGKKSGLDLVSQA